MSTRAAANAGGEDVFASRGMGCSFNTSLLEKAQAQIKAAVNLQKIDDDDDSDGWSDDSDISVEESKQNIHIADETELEIIPDNVQIRPQMNQVAEMLKNLLSNRRSLETLQSYKKFCDPPSEDKVTHYRNQNDDQDENEGEEIAGSPSSSSSSRTMSRRSYSEGYGPNDSSRCDGLVSDGGGGACYGGMHDKGDDRDDDEEQDEGECSHASSVSRYYSSPCTQSQREDAMDCELSTVQSNRDGGGNDDEDGGGGGGGGNDNDELCGSEWDRYQYSVYSQQSQKSDTSSVFDNEGCGQGFRDYASYEEGEVEEEEGEDEECSQGSYRNHSDVLYNPRAPVGVGACIASPPPAPSHPYPPVSSSCDTGNMNMRMNMRMRMREELRDRKNRRSHPHSLPCAPYPVFPCDPFVPRRPQYLSTARTAVHVAQRCVSGSALKGKGEGGGGGGKVFVRASLHPTTKHDNRLHASASAYERKQNENYDTRKSGSGAFGYLMRSSDKNGYGRNSVNKGPETKKKRSVEDSLRRQLVRAELDRVQVLKLIVHLIGKEQLNGFFESEKNHPDMLELLKRTFSKQQDWNDSST